MTLRNSLSVALLLALAGCGCGSDSYTTLTTPGFESATIRPGTELPPCPVESDSTPGARQIDIVFVLDDGWTMENVALGLIPQNLLTDARRRTIAAQAIMRHLQANILASLQARYPLESFDLAFGVGRFEDYGGTFAETGRSFALDSGARPWVLQMPVLRAAHPQFSALFTSAMSRTTPGDGRRIIGGVPTFSDPNSGLEALYQIATGAGLDVDGAAGTLGSGAPCALATQLTPGASGDVPAVTFANTADESDPDGRPVFYVRDENGTVTQIPDPLGGGASVPCIASGNIGGMGWRNNASRFVVLASDIATIAPFSGPVPGNIQSTPGTTASSVLPATGPRGARIVTAQAFNNATARFGTLAGNPQIAPTGAATVEETIAALNDLHIEVFSLAAPFLVSNQVKPNGGFDGTGTDIDDVTPGNAPGQLGNPTLSPWTWLSATSILTGSEISYQDETLATRLLPAVYNLATVWPIDPTATPATPDTGANETLITDHLLEDVAQRLVGPPDATAWIPTFLPAAGGTGVLIEAGDLPTVTVPVTLTYLPGVGFGDNIAATPGATFPLQSLNVSITVYLAGQTPPASAATGFQATTLGAAFADPTPGLIITETLPFRIEADFGQVVITPAGAGEGAQAAAAQIRSKLSNLGVRTLTEASLSIQLENLGAGAVETLVSEITVQTVTAGCGSVVVASQAASPLLLGAQPCDPLAP
ncbi:MAG: hypothetical protein AB7T63_13750 [Planctomycetota bacterium]